MRLILVALVSALALGGVVQAKDMKTCAAEWQAMKKANTTGAQTYKQFTTACMAPPAAAAPAVAAKPVAAPVTPTPAAPPAKAGLFSKPLFGKPAAAPAAPAPAAPVKPVVAAPSAPPKATKPPMATVAPRGPIPPGATAVCRDGTYSENKVHSGSCSRHGGVAQFYK